MKKELRPKPRPKFVLRKVRNGRVKILGNWYSPVVSHPNSPYPRKEYNGELDGMWFAFGLYWTPTTGFENVKWYCEDFVGLWGTKEMYEAETEEEYLEACKNQLKEKGIVEEGD